MTTPTPTTAEQHLAGARDRYLRFVRSRISDPDLAEDVLQDALLKALVAAPDIEDEERLSAWFYRVLRNAVVDAYRRRDVRQRRTEDLDEALPLAEPQQDDELALCECFRDLLPLLNDDYAEVLRALDLGEEEPAAYAARMGITIANLKVRRHRARRALKARLQETCLLCSDHGCLNCTCNDGV